MRASWIFAPTDATAERDPRQQLEVAAPSLRGEAMGASVQAATWSSATSSGVGSA